MSNLSRLWYFFGINVMVLSSVSAQDAVFSQYYASSLYLSPCFAGIEPNLNVGVNTRTQWKSVSAPYTAHQLSIIKPFYKYGLTDHNMGGIGVSIFQDKSGDIGFQSLGASLSGAYNISLNENHQLTLGMNAGVIQKRINLDQLEWGSQFNQFKGFDAAFPADPIQSSGLLSGSKTMLDLGAGLLYYFKPGRDKREKGKSFWLGYSAFHINQPNESLISGYRSSLQMVSKGIAGIEFTLGARFNLSPNVLIVRQGSATPDLKGFTNLQLNAGTYITYMLIESESDFRPKNIILGGWYRVGDAYIVSFGLESDVYTIGLSYDLNQSNLKMYSNGQGAWEVSLKIQIPKKEKIKRYYTPRI